MDVKEREGQKRKSLSGRTFPRDVTRQFVLPKPLLGSKATILPTKPLLERGVPRMSRKTYQP